MCERTRKHAVGLPAMIPTSLCARLAPILRVTNLSLRLPPPLLLE